jgi:hypothetical protein
MAITLSDSKNLQMAELKLKLQTKPSSILKILREHKSEHETSYTPSQTCIHTDVKNIIGYWRVYGRVDSYCVLMIYDTVWSVRWYVDCVWNVTAHAHKTDIVFRGKGRIHLNRRGRQFSRLLSAEVCASAVVMLDTTCSEVVWRVLATYSIRQFPLHFPSLASPCSITFQLDSTYFSGRAHFSTFRK